MQIANIAVAIVGLVHVGIAVCEIFFWKRPWLYERLGLGLTQYEADKIAPIIANAGLYNAFIAAGLLWSVVAANDPTALKFFFLACVAIAGIFGAATLNWGPLVLQTLPALVAAFLVWSASK